MARPEQKKTVVRETEQRSAQGGEDGELVVGPLDRGERDAHRLDLLALVEAASTDEHVRHIEALKRFDVRLGD